MSTISNNSFLWDPDVDGDMVNMPLNPQVLLKIIYTKGEIISFEIHFNIPCGFPHFIRSVGILINCTQDVREVVIAFFAISDPYFSK